MAKMKQMVFSDLSSNPKNGITYTNEGVSHNLGAQWKNRLCCLSPPFTLHFLLVCTGQYKPHSIVKNRLQFMNILYIQVNGIPALTILIMTECRYKVIINIVLLYNLIIPYVGVYDPILISLFTDKMTMPKKRTKGLSVDATHYGRSI